MYRIRSRSKHNTKRAFAHSTYIRDDRAESMKIAAILSEEEGESLSRWITDLIHDILQGDAEIVYKKARKARRGKRAE